MAAGTWKPGNNVIGLGGGGIRHTAEAADVPQPTDAFRQRQHEDMDDVGAGRKGLLDVLAGTHNRDIEIHLSDDGIGRIGRLITSRQCLRAGVPVLIIPVSPGRPVPGSIGTRLRYRGHAPLALAVGGLPCA